MEFDEKLNCTLTFGLFMQLLANQWNRSWGDVCFLLNLALEIFYLVALSGNRGPYLLFAIENLEFMLS